MNPTNSDVDRVLRQFVSDSKDLLKDALHERGKILFASVYGSKAYNTEVQNDEGALGDVDIVAVYVEDPHILLSLPFIVKPPPPAIASPPKTKTTSTSKASLEKQQQQQQRPYDYLVHSLTKFCYMLVNGNPVAVELLFLKKYLLVQSKEWEELVAHRKASASLGISSF